MKNHGVLAGTSFSPAELNARIKLLPTLMMVQESGKTYLRYPLVILGDDGQSEPLVLDLKVLEITYNVLETPSPEESHVDFLFYAEQYEFTPFYVRVPYGKMSKEHVAYNCDFMSLLHPSLQGLITDYLQEFVQGIPPRVL